MHLKKIFFCIALTDTSYFSYAQAANQPKPPLEQALSIYSNANINKAYLNIKGIKWQYKEMYSSKTKSVYNESRLNLKILGTSNLILSGKDDKVEDITINSPQAKTNFKHILQINLPNYEIQELSNCYKKHDSHAKLYRLKAKHDGKTIYADASANLSFKPYQSPLYTMFEFSLQKEDTWICK